VVLTAAQRGSSKSEEALAKLCEVYWYPLYAFIRRRGYDSHDAQDLTQGFFTRLLEKNYLAQADRQKGRFRSFLLAALKHFLADEQDKARAQKRGGGQTLVSFNEQMAEKRYGLEPAEAMSVERLFERRWALTLLEQARTRLREEYVAVGKAEFYDQLKILETGEKRMVTYVELAARLGTTESAIKSAVPRLRRRYAELVREEIAHTVNSPSEIDEEIRYLIAVISS
jgi:RNA polymerase sigma-70 factor (ECF subfamily)